MAAPPGVFRLAFLAPANLLALAAASVGSAVMGDPTAILIALGLEGIYLGGMSLSPRYQRQLRAQARRGASGAGTEALLEELAPNQREHYFALKELRDKILSNYQKLPGGNVLVASSEPRLDTLLQNFVRLLGTLNNYRKYLSAADRAAVDREIISLRAECEDETNLRLREVKQKRVEILEKRLQRFTQAEDSREIVSHQLASIEDLLRLTHEQSIAIRDPDALSRQLHVLTEEIAATDETVRQMEQFMSISEEFAPAGSLSDRGRVRT